MATNDVLIICTSFSIFFIIVAVVCLFFVPLNDRIKYRKYLTFMREDVSHKMNEGEQDVVRDWYNNKLMYLRYSKLPNKHRVLSSYQIFLVLFTVGVLLAFIPFSIYDNSNNDGFTNFFKTIFLTIKSFFWGSSFEKLQPIDGDFSTFYLHYMSVIFVVAGLVVAFSVFKLFKEFLSYLKYWSIHPLSDIYVFSKLNEKSIALAEDVFKNEKTIKTIKKIEDRENDNEQKLIYIENKYKYAIIEKKENKREAKKKRDDDVKYVLENMEKKKEYDDAKLTYKNVVGLANYARDTLKHYKDKMKKAKTAYKLERNYLLVNAVERGWLHVFATIKSFFIDLFLFLIYSVSAFIVCSVFVCIFILTYLIYILLLIPITGIYLISCIFGIKTLMYNVKEGYINLWKRCQAFMAKSVLNTLEFSGGRSNWFDKLFHKRYIYFCDVYARAKDSHDELMDRAKYIGATVMKRDVTELRMKWWCRSRTIYLISDNDNENTEHAAYLQNACTRSSTQKEMLNNSRTEIYVFASNSESEFIINDLNNKLVREKVRDFGDKGVGQDENLNNKSFDIMRIRRINEYSNFATSFFWNRYDKFFCKDNTDMNELNVAMIGCGRYGREFVKVLCCLGQLPGYKITISIFDKDIEKVKANISKELIQNSALPLFTDVQENGVPIYSISFAQCNVIDDADFVNRIASDNTHIFVMLGNDELNIKTAMLLRQKYRREKPVENQPLIYSVVNDYQRHYNLKQGDELYKYAIKPIGRTVTRYSERAIQQKEIERWARVVHTSFMLNDLLSRNFEKLLPKCDEYKTKIQKKENETIFDILDKKCVDLIDFTYPFISHEIYRLWQVIVANKIRYIDFNNLNDTWKLISDIKAAILDRMTQTRLLQDMEFILKDNVDKETIQRVGCGLFESVIIPWLNDIIKDFIPPENVFDFDSREYLRRSSKARALYEHILFKKNMIKYDEKSHVVVNNCKKMRVWFADDEAGKFIRHRWENAQWIALNDLMQKRWMVFMWGEGYTYKSDYEGKKRTDVIEKTHKYLKPYVEICKNEQDKTRQTMEIIHVCE